eukprot:gene23891-9457_t
MVRCSLNPSKVCLVLGERQIYLAGWPALIASGSTAVMPLLAFTPTHVSEELSNRPALIASGSIARRQCLEFSPTRVTDESSNLPALNASGPKAVQPLDSNERHVSEAPNNSPEEDASGSGDGMPRDEMQGQNKAVMSLLGGKTSHSMLPKAHPNAVAKVAPHKQPLPPIPGRSALEKKKFKPPAQASGAERHSQPPPIEDDSNGEGQKGKRTCRGQGRIR